MQKKSKLEVMASIKDGSILDNIRPPLAEQIRIRNEHLAKQNAEFESRKPTPVQATTTGPEAHYADPGVGGR